MRPTTTGRCLSWRAARRARSWGTPAPPRLRSRGRPATGCTGRGSKPCWARRPRLPPCALSCLLPGLRLRCADAPAVPATAACRDACKQEKQCITDKCYAEAAAAYPPLSGGGARLTLPWLMRRATGANVRLVVMLRDPVERLHASFWHYDHVSPTPPPPSGCT